MTKEENFQGIPVNDRRRKSDVQASTTREFLKKIVDIDIKNKTVKLANGSTHKLNHEEIDNLAKIKPHPILRGLAQETEYLQWLRNFIRGCRLADEAVVTAKIQGAENAVDRLSYEEFDHIVKRKLKGGYPVSRISAIDEQVKIEKRQEQENETQRRIKEEDEAKARNTPLRRLLRNYPLRNVAEAYKQEVESIRKEDVNVQTEIRTTILNTSSQVLWPSYSPERAEEEKTALLTWLNSVISQNDQQQEPIKSLRNLVHTFRGH